MDIYSISSLTSQSWWILECVGGATKIFHEHLKAFVEILLLLPQVLPEVQITALNYGGEPPNGGCGRVSVINDESSLFSD